MQKRPSEPAFRRPLTQHKAPKNEPALRPDVCAVYPEQRRGNQKPLCRRAADDLRIRCQRRVDRRRP